MRDLTFQVTDEVLQLGVQIVTVCISNMKNFVSNAEFESLLRKELDTIKSKWEGKIYKDSEVLQGFRELHTKVGRSNRDYPASPEVLLRLLLEKDRFPRINGIVDIYNLISLKFQLALGAHDIAHIHGNITLRITRGDEIFLPLGKLEQVAVPAGEYAYVDDGNNIICRLEVLQVEPTKITLESEDIFFIIQGNANTSSEYVHKTADALILLLTRFCGGTPQFLV